MPEKPLRAQQEAAADPFGQSFAGLQRGYAKGDPIEMAGRSKSSGCG